MRISAGKYKGRKLFFPKNVKELRPTTAKVKEAVFSMLYDRVIDARFLDLFAGVGNIGFEALSRGAAEVYFIDCEPSFIFKNAQELACLDKVKIYKNFADKAVKIMANHGEKFDIIFIDPPYADGLLEDSLNKLFHFDILNSRGCLVIETDKNTAVKTNFRLVKEKVYGQTKIIFLER